MIGPTLKIDTTKTVIYNEFETSPYPHPVLEFLWNGGDPEIIKSVCIDDMPGTAEMLKRFAAN